MFDRRRTNARFRGSLPVGNIVHSFGESAYRTLPPAPRPAPPHSLRAEGGTAALHISAEKVPSCRKEASTASPGRAEQRKVHCQQEMAWQESVTITATKEPLPVVHCPSWLARSGLPALLGSVVNMLGQGYAFWASSVETFYCREQKLEDAPRYRRRATCFRFHYVTPGQGDMVADDRARAFQDPTLLRWDETAQLLRRVRSLWGTNPMARQLGSVHEILRKRISTLPRLLESDPSFEFEERPTWCDALHAADEIEDWEVENLISRALLHAKHAFRGLAGKLDRRVRAWILTNSTTGAGALYKWVARDDLAPRLSQQALDSAGRRLLTPWEMLELWKAKWRARWKQHRDGFVQLQSAVCQLRHEIRAGIAEHGLAGGIHPETLLAQEQL